MKICIHCFVDVEIKGIIETLKTVGDCDICDTRNNHIYDTVKHTALERRFNTLLERYTIKTILGMEYPSNLTVSIKSELRNNWRIFNELSESQIYDILINICPEKYTETPDFFDDLVGVAELADNTYLKANTLFHSGTWDDFSNELKYITRFHSEKFNTDIFSMYLNTLTQFIHKGTLLYRGRVSNADGYPVAKMGSVCPGKTKSGRANPKGIPYLYLADDIKTVFHELRLTKMNYVTIASFVLNKNGNIIDLTKIGEISPFSFESEEMITLHIVNKNHLEKIHTEIIKPISKDESYLDYIPTQYIFDFIRKNSKILSDDKKDVKSEEIIGVKYRSSLNSGGINYVFFEGEDFDIENPIIYKIDNVDYQEIEIN